MRLNGQAKGRRVLSALLVAACAAFSLCGCRTGRYTVENPESGRVLEVKSGDRLYFEFEENATTGYLWRAFADDEALEFGYEHLPAKETSADGRTLCGAPGRARVMVRVHRGFKGPTPVTFKYMRSWSKEVAKETTFTFVRFANDLAPWR